VILLVEHACPWSMPATGATVSTLRATTPFRDGAAGGSASAAVDRYLFTVRQSSPT